MFDSTEANGRKPLSFRFGKKQQIQGLESVIANMQPGGECTCSIPPQCKISLLSSYLLSITNIIQ